MAANPKEYEHYWPMRMTVEEYLKLDESSTDVRYEYLDGQVYAMAGGTADHSTLKINVVIALRTRLGKGPCRVYDTDMQVQLANTRYVYPDATVTCNAEDMLGDSTRIYSPRIVIEVLSPSTERRDRTKKLAAYQQCPTLQEYVLIDYTHQCVEIYRRQDWGWSYHRFIPDHEVELATLNLHIPFSELYNLTNIPEEDEWEDDQIPQESL